MFIPDSALNFGNNIDELYKFLRRIEEINDCIIIAYDKEDIRNAVVSVETTEDENFIQNLWNSEDFRFAFLEKAISEKQIADWLVDMDYRNFFNNTQTHKYILQVLPDINTNLERIFHWSIFLSNNDSGERELVYMSYPKVYVREEDAYNDGIVTLMLFKSGDHNE